MVEGHVGNMNKNGGNMKKEWEKLLEKNQEIYIFGAGDVARRLVLLADASGSKEKIKFILVSNMKGNPNEILGIKVCLVDEIQQKDIAILVSVSKPYHPEVFSMLEQKGFKNIIEAHKYYNIEISKDKTNVKTKEVFIQNAIVLDRRKKNLQEKLIDLFCKNVQTFGNEIFYQSFPQLDLIGVRPTEKRIEMYGLDDFLSIESKVLDIGCNSGFFDLTIAPKVKSVLGVEYSKNLVEIATQASRDLQINNVSFICSDFNYWEKNTFETFDVIFSFAVHIWLNVSPKQYAERINSFLNIGGYLIFESQTLKSDILFEEFCQQFKNVGLKEINSNYIMDDLETERKYCIFMK